MGRHIAWTIFGFMISLAFLVGIGNIQLSREATAGATPKFVGDTDYCHHSRRNPTLLSL
jgi:hypothetical protein